MCGRRPIRASRRTPAVRSLETRSAARSSCNAYKSHSDVFHLSCLALLSVCLSISYVSLIYEIHQPTQAESLCRSSWSAPASVIVSAYLVFLGAGQSLARLVLRAIPEVPDAKT